MNYKIKIEHPCEQNWEEMIPTQGGKYCLHCSKNIIDFTNLSDKEIIQIISKSSGTLCGSLTRNQLNRHLSSKREHKYPTLFSKIAASFLLISLTQPTNANPLKKAIPSFVVFPPETAKEKTNQEPITTGDSTVTIRGKLLDAKTKETIPGATVLIQNSNIATSTNMDGEFKLDVSSASSTITVLISNIGYEPLEVKLKVGEPQHEIFMNVSQQTLRGSMEITLYKAKWWQVGRRLKNWYIMRH